MNLLRALQENNAAIQRRTARKCAEIANKFANKFAGCDPELGDFEQGKCYAATEIRAAILHAFGIEGK